ncbi:MAG: hypothetical protein AAF798_03745 [Bacteroidota bacterium]
MKIRPEDLQEDSKNAGQQMLDWSSKNYSIFNEYVAFQPDDSVGMMAFKLFLRFLGFLILLILSPFLIIGLIIAFATVL